MEPFHRQVTAAPGIFALTSFGGHPPTVMRAVQLYEVFLPSTATEISWHKGEAARFTKALGL